LRTAKGREKSGVFFVEGPKILQQIMATNPGAVKEILVDETSDYRHFYPGDVRMLTSRQFQSITMNKTPQGVAGIIAIPEDIFSVALPDQAGERVLLLEEIQDPGNIGTLIRTAAAFNFSGVVLSETCADPFAPKAVQASAGAVLSVWIRRTKRYFSLVDTLRSQGFFLAAADIDGENNFIGSGVKKVLLALGNEGNGLSQRIRAQADAVFRISYNDKAIESLNVAVAGAISMYRIDRGG
jgi:TrmH family RNA methyltransferase